MFSNWFFYVFLAGVSSVIFNYLNRYILKDNDDATSYGWWFEVFRTLIFLPFVVFSAKPDFNLQNILLFAFIGISEIFSVYFYMKMHAKSELSFSMIVSQLRLVWIAILAFFILGERLASVEYLGILFVVLGQVVVALPKKLIFDKGLKYALLSSIFTATNSILAKSAAPAFSTSLYIVAMGLPTILFFPLVMNEGKKRLHAFKGVAFRQILFAVTFNALAMVFLLAALKLGPVSTVIAIFQSMMVLSIAAGIILLKERDNLANKIIGSFIVFTGTLFLLGGQ